MNRKSANNSAHYFLAALVLLAIALASPVHAQTMRPAVLQDVGIEQKLNQPVPLDLVFRNETGRPVRLGDYFGEKPVVLTLVYYECPMLCTLVLNGLLRSLRTLAFDAGKQFNIITVSFDPGETPVLAAAKKEHYLERYARPGAADGWHFLTGEEASIQKLARAVGFRYAYDAQKDQYAHASGIMVLTPQGRVARYFYGVEYAPRDLRLGLVEAAAQRIGSAIDQVLLFCYHYDPVTGKYGVMIMNVIRLAGLTTVVALGTFIGVMLRRDRRLHTQSV